MQLGFSSMNTAEDPAPDLLARTLEEAGFCTDREQELYDYLESTNTDAFLLLKDLVA